jgi:hypothetical protein
MAMSGRLRLFSLYDDNLPIDKIGARLVLDEAVGLVSTSEHWGQCIAQTPDCITNLATMDRRTPELPLDQPVVDEGSPCFSLHQHEVQ